MHLILLLPLVVTGILSVAAYTQSIIYSIWLINNRGMKDIVKAEEVKGKVIVTLICQLVFSVPYFKIWILVLAIASANRDPFINVRELLLIVILPPVFSIINLLLINNIIKTIKKMSRS